MYVCIYVCMCASKDLNSPPVIELQDDPVKGPRNRSLN